MNILNFLANLASLKKTARKINSGEPLKICYVAPFGLITKGTTAARLLPIAQAMAERGHQVRVIVPPWDDPATSPDLQLGQPRSEIRYRLELVFVPVKYMPQPLTIPLQMLKTIVEFQPDVIHVFKPKAFSGLSALLINLLKIPFVLDTDDWEGRGGYNEISPYSLPQKLLFNWQEQDLPKRAVGVTVASRTLETQVWGFGVNKDRSVYLPNGIAPEKYAAWNKTDLNQKVQEQRKMLGFSPDDFVLVAYTRFVEFEPKRLLQIFQLVLKKLPNAKLLVIGGGFYNEEKNFLAAAERLGICNLIKLTGRIKPEEVSLFLRCGDIAVYPFEDNLINRARSSAKFLDILMAEVPVISEAVGELREYLVNGKGGLLVAPGDNRAFAQAVVELAAMPENSRSAFAGQAAQRLLTDYTWVQLTEPLEDFYRQLKR